MKYDGTSISITYENGRLVRAVTRGDGTQGDDVTANVKTIRSIPLVLQPGDWPHKFEIRGEILMPWKVPVDDTGWRLYFIRSSRSLASFSSKASEALR